MKKSLLDGCGLLKLLTVVFSHGPMPVHRIPRYGVGVGTAYRSAREAAMMGLAHLYHCGSTLCIELTEKGKEIAKLLLEAEKKYEKMVDEAIAKLVKEIEKDEPIVIDIG